MPAQPAVAKPPFARWSLECSLCSRSSLEPSRSLHRALLAPYLEAVAANANAMTESMATHPPLSVSIAFVGSVAPLVDRAVPPR